MLPTSINDLNVAVIGLGYVGLPLAAAFANQRNVIGFDINEKRVSELIEGYDHTGELDSEDLASATTLHITSAPEMLAKCNFYIVTVPTPVDSLNRPNLGPLLDASRQIAKFLEAGDVVVFESTVFPGATEEVCGQLLEELSGLRFARQDAGEYAGEFFLGYSPERANPGDRKHRIKDIVKVTSGSTRAVATLIDDLYATIIEAGTYRSPSIKVAEASKVIENIQRDVNVALVNELALIFHRLEIDTDAVLKTAAPKWNFVHFKPGLVGGHCIGVDPYYLVQKANEVGHHPEIILASRRINDSMSEHVAERVVNLMQVKGINLNEAKLLILGVSFKENCPDTRNSKVLDLVNSLSKFCCHIDVFDPLVDPATVEFDGSAQMIRNPKLGCYDAVVLAVPHMAFVEKGADELRKYGTPLNVFFDLKSAFGPEDSDGRL